VVIPILELLAFYLSYLMAVFLFSYAYIEGIKIAEAEKFVYGGTFIFSIVSALVFSRLTYIFM
jgi:hypothetical protein